MIGFFVFLVTFGIMLWAVSHGLHKSAELRETWRKLAERHRLRFDPGRRLVGAPSVVGTLEGRGVHVQAVRKNDKSYTAQLKVDLRGRLPSNLHVAAPAPAARLSGLGEVVPTGPESFDEQVAVRGEEAEEIKAYFTDARREAVLQLVELGGQIEDDKLLVHLDKADDELEQIDKSLHELCRLARVFDARMAPAT